MFKLKMIFIALFGLIHTQGFAAAPAAAGAGAAVSSDSDSDFEVFIPRDINKEYRQQITWLNAMLAKASDEEMRNQAFDRVTHRLIDCTFPAEVLELWLQGPGNPNNVSQGYKTSPLYDALECLNEKAIKILLADHRTKIDDPKHETPYFTAYIYKQASQDHIEFYGRIMGLVRFLSPEKGSLLYTSEELKEFEKIKLARQNTTPTTLMNAQIDEKLNKEFKKLSLQNGVVQTQASETSLQAPLSTQVAVGGKKNLLQTSHQDEPAAKKQKAEIQHPQQAVLGK